MMDDGSSSSSSSQESSDDHGGTTLGTDDQSESHNVEEVSTTGESQGSMSEFQNPHHPDPATVSDEEFQEVPQPFHYDEDGSGATASSSEMEHHQIDDKQPAHIPSKKSNKRKKRSKGKGKHAQSSKRQKSADESGSAATADKPADDKLPSTSHSHKHWLVKNQADTTTIPKQMNTVRLVQVHGLQIPDMTQMNHIVFWDTDNFPTFFSALPSNLPEKTFVWAFKGVNNLWKPPVSNAIYENAVARGLVHHQQDSGPTKNAADFSICVMAGVVHLLLSDSVPFSIVSNDKGFKEVERIFEGTPRTVVLIDPYGRDKQELFTMLDSMTE